MSKIKAINDKSLPFQIYSSSIDTGYQSELSSAFSPHTSIENNHNDNYTQIYLEGTLQGTYADSNVGGRKSNHIEISSSFSRLNRPERYDLHIETGNLSVYTPSVGKPADRAYRFPLAKRPFGFENIQNQNFSKNYEVLSTCGRSINNRDFYHSGGYEVFERSSITAKYLYIELKDPETYDLDLYLTESYYTIPSLIDNINNVLQSYNDNYGCNLRFILKNGYVVFTASQLDAWISDNYDFFLIFLKSDGILHDRSMLNLFGGIEPGYIYYNVVAPGFEKQGNKIRTNYSENPILNNNISYNLGSRTKTGKSVIVNRFGTGVKKSSLDYNSLEYSSYSIQPWKDWFARKINNHINSKVFMQGYEPTLRTDYNYNAGQNYTKLVNYIEHKTNLNTQWSSKKSLPRNVDSGYDDIPAVLFCFDSAHVNEFNLSDYFYIDNHINKHYASYITDDSLYVNGYASLSKIYIQDVEKFSSVISRPYDSQLGDDYQLSLPLSSGLFYSQMYVTKGIEGGNIYFGYPSKTKAITTNKLFSTFYVNQLAPIFDNHYVTHQIPQNDIQYWWQNKSLNHSASYYGYFNKDNPGVYQTASEVEQINWNISTNLTTYATIQSQIPNNLAASFAGYSIYINEPINVNTGKIGYESSSYLSAYRYKPYLPAGLIASTAEAKFLERSYISTLQKAATAVAKGCPEFFTVINQTRNGIYGWPSWKQYTTNNSLLRYQKNKHYIINRGNVYREPSLAYNKKCYNLIKDNEGNSNLFAYTFANNNEHFANEILENSTKQGINKTFRDKIIENNYSIKNIKYVDIIYPDKTNIGLQTIRRREQFEEWWKNDTSLRRTASKFIGGPGTYNNGGYFGDTIAISQFDLDERVPLLNGFPNTQIRRSINYMGNEGTYYYRGILQSAYTIFYNPQSWLNEEGILDHYKTPIYARPTHSGSLAYDGLNFGEAYIFDDTKWDVANQAGRQPYYQTYDEYLLDIKPLTQNKSLLPEFRISQHIDYYLENGGNFLIKNDNFLEVRESAIPSSSLNNFYETYSYVKSNSKNLELLTNKKTKKIELSCEGVVKFLPYKGFYPVERTVACVDNFSASFSWESGTTVAQSVEFVPDKPIYSVLFTPGILYNTIKSGVAVDYPKLTGSLAPITGTNGAVWNNADIANFTFDEGLPRYNLELANPFSTRYPFEALIEPDKYLDYVLDTEVTPLSRMSGVFCKDIKTRENGKPIYQMSIHNFLAESINLFLKNGKLSSFSSRPKDEIVVDKNVNEYCMIVKMVSKPWEQEQDPDFYSVKKPKFIMFSSGSAFGPASYIGGSNQLKRINHIYSPFTPPYFDSSYGSELLIKFIPYKTDGYSYTLEEIVNNSQFITGITITNGSSTKNIERHCGIPCDDPTDGLPEYIYGTDKYIEIENQGNWRPSSNNFQNNVMQLTASINPKIVESIKNVEYDVLSGTPKNIQDSIDKKTWIIQTKFETPILNFYDSVIDYSHLDTSAITEQCVGMCNKGMWFQYSEKLKENEGVYLSISDIEDIIYNDSGWLNFNADKIHTGSLADLVGFDKKEIRLGEVANSKFIREAVVAIPYIEDGNDRKYFYINDDDVEKIINDDPKVSINLRNTAKAMKNYVFPPRFDWVTNRYKFSKMGGSDIVRPFKMFVFEFEKEFSSQDLTDIWQNIMPESYKEFEIQQRRVTIDVEEHPDILEKIKELKWMVFKVKQKAEKNYYAKTADSSDDSRFSFELKYGNKGRKNFVPDYSFNWPYDWMSLVEFAGIEMTVEAEEEPPNIPENLRIQ